MSDPSDPGLDLAYWLMRLREFALECASAGSAEEVPLLRDALDLLALAPREVRPLLGTPPDPAWIDGVIAAGASPAAALAMLGEWAGYMLSHGPGGRHMASVAIRGGNEASADGDTATLALLGALALALAANLGGAGRRAGPRLN